MVAKSKWKRFEDLAAHIQQSFAPGASVEQNVRILGLRSKVLREVDIAVRTRVGQYSIFIAIDCKDYRRKINVKDVETFIGLIKDVGANKGAMIAVHGFSPAAKNRARDAGVDLYRLVDAESHEWQAYVTIPVLIDDRSSSAFSLSFSCVGPAPIIPRDFKNMMLYRADGTEIGIVRNLLADRWNANHIPHEPGEHQGIPLTEEKTFICTNDILSRVDVKANVRVVQTLLFGQLPLIEVKGFSDELEGSLVTNAIKTASEAVLDRGQVMAEALTVLASRGTFAAISNPVAWQRETRSERTLPNREP